MSTPGLRERKKVRTRQALVDAAYELFAQQGFAATTVDQIAAAVEMSARTFHRYFASKEDAALSVLTEQHDAMVEALRSRPADEPAMTAMRNAVVEVLTAYEADENCDAFRFHQLQTLIAGNPALRAAAAEHSTARTSEVAELIAGRMGVEPATDPRPGLVAAVALCAAPAAVDARRHHEPSRSASELYGQVFDLLGSGMDYPAAVTARGVRSSKRKD
ncbi:TetR family transcriptional regulator [Lentzea albida]|uniref:Transcriptional regulator, TetR family n=1 Tax=Lentzea albida TaxID=65499 RepID=A0A1H9X3Z8_9PSEU|nr:TetR family transcriptional regulator [Lentzea albida]SES40617.1 transcriptional regulator, TetR family [Lentzea albida]